MLRFFLRQQVIFELIFHFPKLAYKCIIIGVFPSNYENENMAKFLRMIKIFVFCTILFGFYLLTLIYSFKYLHMMEAMQAAGYINNGVLCVAIGYACLIYNRNKLLNSIGGWEQAIRSSK